jgi:hypothetical protein
MAIRVLPPSGAHPVMAFSAGGGGGRHGPLENRHRKASEPETGGA